MLGQTRLQSFWISKITVRRVSRRFSIFMSFFLHYSRLLFFFPHSLLIEDFFLGFPVSSRVSKVFIRFFLWIGYLSVYFTEYRKEFSLVWCASDCVLLSACLHIDAFVLIYRLLRQGHNPGTTFLYGVQVRGV